MSANRSEEQVTVALEYVQGKRRLEHVVQAANALADKFVGADATERVRLAYELLRRNFADNIHVDFRGHQFATSNDAAQAHPMPTVTASIDLVIHDEKVGTVNVEYRPPGKLGLTSKEWETAIELLTNVVALGIGGHPRWNQ